MKDNNKINEIINKMFSKFKNKGIFLENNESVKSNEIEEAAKQYINSEQNDPNQTYKVIKRRKFKFWPLPLVLAVMTVMMLGFEKKESTITPSSVINYSEIFCDVYGINPEIILDNLSNVQTISNDNISFIGENESMINSCSFDYISIQDGNQIIDIEIKQGEDIKDVIDVYCKKNFKNIEELNIKIHFDGPISGWINLNDILKENLGNQSIQINIMLDEYYQGNFLIQRKYEEGENKLPIIRLTLPQKNVNNGTNVDGETVQLSEDMVSIDIVDKNGNLLPEGSIVVGSDGQKYIITNLDVNTKKVLELYPNETVSESKWNIQNIKKNISLALMPIIIGLYSSYMFYKLEEEEIDKENDVKSR